jgi:hypothetical protein
MDQDLRHRHRPEGEAEKSVILWAPTARIATPEPDTFAVTTDDGFTYPSASSIEDAWENAFTAMQTVNAYYLSGPPECTDGTPIENWMDAEGNIEDGPLEPVTVAPVEAPADTEPETAE